MMQPVIDLFERSTVYTLSASQLHGRFRSAEDVIKIKHAYVMKNSRSWMLKSEVDDRQVTLGVSKCINDVIESVVLWTHSLDSTSTAIDPKAARRNGVCRQRYIDA